MKKILISAILILFSTCLFSQNNKQRIFSTNEIYFYGYDFSHFKLAEAKRLNDGYQVKSFFVPWVGYMDANFPHSEISGKMGVSLIPRYDVTIKLNELVNTSNVVTIFEHLINQDIIVDAIKNYELQEQSGIGFVAIIECFYKATKTASVYYVFFDISTREILDSYRFTSTKTGGLGLTSFWGKNLEANFKKYINKYYLSKKRANK